MSDIPQARAKLDEICADLRAAGQWSYAREIETEVLPLMARKPPIKRPRSKVPASITPAIRRDLIAFFESGAGWGMTHLEIAERFGVNPGRVSELMNEWARP